MGTPGTLVVTTRAVVWIEIYTPQAFQTNLAVTTRAVVWIEIEEIAIKSKNIAGHHPCGGVN